MKEPVTEIDLAYEGHAAVSVEQPKGGKYVCDVSIEASDTRYILRNIHIDVADSLRDGLNRVIAEMEREGN